MRLFPLKSCAPPALSAFPAATCIRLDSIRRQRPRSAGRRGSPPRTEPVNAGLGWVRIDFISGARGRGRAKAYNCTYDALAAAARRRGLDLYLPSPTPAWATRAAVSGVPRNPDDWRPSADERRCATAARSPAGLWNSPTCRSSGRGDRYRACPRRPAPTRSTPTAGRQGRRPDPRPPGLEDADWYDWLRESLLEGQGPHLSFITHPHLRLERQPQRHLEARGEHSLRRPPALLQEVRAPRSRRLSRTPAGPTSRVWLAYETG